MVDLSSRPTKSQPSCSKNPWWNKSNTWSSCRFPLKYIWSIVPYDHLNYHVASNDGNLRRIRVSLGPDPWRGNHIRLFEWTKEGLWWQVIRLDYTSGNGLHRIRTAPGCRMLAWQGTRALGYPQSSTYIHERRKKKWRARSKATGHETSQVIPLSQICFLTSSRRSPPPLCQYWFEPKDLQCSKPASRARMHVYKKSGIEESLCMAIRFFYLDNSSMINYDLSNFLCIFWRLLPGPNGGTL